MNRDQIKGYVGITGITLGHVEKDYLQHIVLSSISRREGGDLVFKGGTALQKMGYVKRFSEDLDFTARADIDLSDMILSCEEDLKRYGFVSDHDRVFSEKNSSSARVKIKGPLFDRGGVPCSISLDISFREEVLLPAKAMEFSPIYPDIPPYILLTMDPAEILAEKVRTIMTRRRQRDLYDLSILIQRGFGPDMVMIQKKLDYYGISFDMNTFFERCESGKDDWERELKHLVKVLPDLRDSVNTVKDAFTK